MFCSSDTKLVAGSGCMPNCMLLLKGMMFNGVTRKVVHHNIGFLVERITIQKKKNYI